VYKETIGRAVDPCIEINADLGIEKLYENRLTPKKHHKLRKRTPSGWP
jgi:hypothetical protein